MALKVCKFGGTSLADAGQIQKVRQIVSADVDRRFVVPSAPGKRTKEDQKVTDLLYLCHEHARQGLPVDEVFGRIAERFMQIAADLGLTLDLRSHLEAARAGIQAAGQAGDGPDFAASRGEYLNGLLIAELLDFPFVDPAEVIRFGADGRLDEATTYHLFDQKVRPLGRAVVPGFFGATPAGKVKTFSRGGSDVTGSIVARGVGATVYENWTDVTGLLITDPRIVANPRPIETITYRELRELSYSGATVLHEDAVFPVRAARIPVNIRSTNQPEHPGTMIVASDDPAAARGDGVTGIAGRKDFTILSLEKAMMNAELGFGRRVLRVLEDRGISFEHMPSGIDTLGLVVADSFLPDQAAVDGLVHELEEAVKPDAIEVDRDLALIATVGRGMSRRPGMAARVFGALAEAGVNIRLIDQGSSELNIIVGVNSADYETAVRAIYQAFFGDAG